MSDPTLMARLKALEERIARTEVRERGIPAGTSFPTGISAGFLFFRTDLGWLCYYDGTRWLTVHTTELRFPHTTYSAAGTDFANRQSITGDYTLYLNKWQLWVNTGATNNGSNYWTINLYRNNGTQTLASVNTSALGAGANDQTLDVSTGGFTQPSGAGFYLALNLAKTAGAPTNIEINSVVRFRYVVT